MFENRQCLFCKRERHGIEWCWELREILGLPRQPVGNERRLFQELEKLGVFKTLLAAREGTSTGQVPQNTRNTNPYSALQEGLAALAAKYSDSQ